MAATVGMITTAWFGRRTNLRKSSRSGRVSMSMTTAPSRVSDPYEILQIRRSATESDVKKAFRKLALKHHPDVCKGDNCGIQFNQIHEAYDAVMERFREDIAEESYELDAAEDMWEEWMGWEGAGIRDYTSHINPYI